MKATLIVKTGIKIAIALLVVAGGYAIGPAAASAGEPARTANLPAGITLDPSFTLQDTQYLENSLQLLKESAPEWFEYVAEATPFVLSIDTAQGEKGRAATASCCDSQGRGSIVFGSHLGYSWNDESAEASWVTFIGTLVHEVTHLREQRSGSSAVKADFKSCVAVEKPGLEKQLEVKRALSAGNTDAAYSEALQGQVAEETAALKSRALWDFYCGAFK